MNRNESAFVNLRSLPDLLGFIARFVRDPIQTMRKPLRLSWPAAISLQAGAAMISGILVGAFSRNFMDFLLGLILFPASAVLMSFVISVFFYYFFIAFRSTYLDYRRLHSIVVVATMPYFLFHVLAGFLPPIDLVGFALASLLLIVGLVEQFDVERRFATRLLIGIYSLFLVVWIVATLRGPPA